MTKQSGAFGRGQRGLPRGGLHPRDVLHVTLAKRIQAV
jgi:hypothetical protein